MTTPMRTFLRAPAILALCAAICAPVAAAADVVRPAPNFGIDGVAKGTSLRSFHGQSVVLVITKSARVKEFRRELARLKQMYSQFSNEKVIFVAAIENGPAEVRSDIRRFMTKSEASLRRTAAETARTTARDRAREYSRRKCARTFPLSPRPTRPRWRRTTG